MDKLIRVKVTTPVGDKFLTYEHVEGIEKELVCVRGCAYANICDKLRDPRDPENKELSFTDFCGDVGRDFTDEEKQKAIGDYVPRPGTIEQNLYSLDILQEVIKENPVFPLTGKNGIIENVCKGWCDFYNEEHTNCTADNGLCIIRNLLIKDNKK